MQKKTLVTNIRDVCMDFEPYFNVHNLVSVQPKSIILGQMPNLNRIFHVVVSVYRFVKIWNSPQFPAEFRNFAAKPSRDQLFIKLWATTLRMPEMEKKACQIHSNGQVWSPSHYRVRSNDVLNLKKIRFVWKKLLERKIQTDVLTLKR